MPDELAPGVTHRTQSVPFNKKNKLEPSPDPLAHLGVNRRSHGDFRASAPRNRTRLLDGLGQHAQGVVQRSLRLVQHVLAAERERERVYMEETRTALSAKPV